ncbi:MAG: tetratricopeptide repeat protein [Bacillota bacterium]
MKLEQLLGAGAYLQVRREADRLLLEGNLSVREEGSVYRMACRACLSLSEYYAAAKLGERAVERAKEAGDELTLGKAHFDLGSAYLYIGDAYGAEQNLESFLALLPSLTGLERWEGMAHYNMSHVHRQRKQWAKAVVALQQAAELFERRDQKFERAQVALDLAWCHLMLGETALAAPHLTRLEEHLRTHHDDALSADLICEKALYYRLEGDISTSTRLCQEIFMPGRQGVTPKHLGEATWVMGENALDLGRIEEASLFANMALDHAARDNYPTLMNLACDLRRRIATHLAAGA